MKRYLAWKYFLNFLTCSDYDTFLICSLLEVLGNFAHTTFHIAPSCRNVFHMSTSTNKFRIERIGNDLWWNMMYAVPFSKGDTLAPMMPCPIMHCFNLSFLRYLKIIIQKKKDQKFHIRSRTYSEIFTNRNNFHQ